MTPDELLIIEEPEVSIHVGAAQLLFDVLKQASRRGAVLLSSAISSPSAIMSESPYHAIAEHGDAVEPVWRDSPDRP